MIEGKWYKNEEENFYLRFLKKSKHGYYVFDKSFNKEMKRKFIICSFHPISQGWLIPASGEEIKSLNLE